MPSVQHEVFMLEVGRRLQQYTSHYSLARTSLEHEPSQVILFRGLDAQSQWQTRVYVLKSSDVVDSFTCLNGSMPLPTAAIARLVATDAATWQRFSARPGPDAPVGCSQVDRSHLLCLLVPPWFDVCGTRWFALQCAKLPQGPSLEGESVGKAPTALSHVVLGRHVLEVGRCDLVVTCGFLQAQTWALATQSPRADQSLSAIL